MKAAQIFVVLFAALVGSVWSTFEGTNEEFINTIASGNIPDGILPEEPILEDRNLRFAREPQSVGQRCGRNTACEEGIECLSGGLGNYCVPRSCMEAVFDDYIKQKNLNDLPQTLMEKSGFMGRMGDAVNRTTEGRLGFGAAASNTAALMNDDFRMGMADAIKETLPLDELTEVLTNMVSMCPQMASTNGVTIMVGAQYELAAALSWINSFYIAVGTGLINFNIENSTSGINAGFNITAGIYSDICAGVGPNVGFEAGFIVGAALTGSDTDLAECSFLFDFDAGVGSSFGLSIGVTSTRCIPKFMLTQGWGVGLGAGFMGCGGCLIERLTFGA